MRTFETTVMLCNILQLCRGSSRTQRRSNLHASFAHNPNQRHGRHSHNHSKPPLSSTPAFFQTKNPFPPTTTTTENRKSLFSTSLSRRHSSYYSTPTTLAAASSSSSTSDGSNNNNNNSNEGGTSSESYNDNNGNGGVVQQPNRRVDDYASKFFTSTKATPPVTSTRLFPPSSSQQHGNEGDNNNYNNNSHESSSSSYGFYGSTDNNHGKENEYGGDDTNTDNNGSDRRDSAPLRPRASSSSNQGVELYDESEKRTMQPYEKPTRQQQYTNSPPNRNHRAQKPQQQQQRQPQREQRQPQRQSQREQPTSTIQSTRALYQFRPLPPGSSRLMPPTTSDYDDSNYNSIGDDGEASGGSDVVASNDDNYANNIDDDPYGVVEGGSTFTAKASFNDGTAKNTPVKNSVVMHSNEKNFFDSDDTDDELSFDDGKEDTPPPPPTPTTSSEQTSTFKAAAPVYPDSLPRVTPTFEEPVQTKEIVGSNEKNFFDSDDTEPSSNYGTEDAPASSDHKTAPKAHTSVTPSYPRAMVPRVTPSFMEPTKTKAMIQSTEKGSTNNDDDDNPPLVRKLPTEASSGTSATSHLTSLSRQLEHLTSQIYQLNDGVEFNVNSPKQVAGVLFGEDNVAGSSTNKDVLEAMASAGNEMAACIYKFRKLSREVKREERRLEQQERGDKKNDYFGNLARSDARKRNAVSGGEGSSSENDDNSQQVNKTTTATDATTTSVGNNNNPRREPLLLIDTSAYIYRAYHSIPPLHRSDGTPTGALHGVCRMLQNLLLTRLLKGERPRVVLAFDFKGPNFRHEMYPEYKANRGPCPEDLVPQFALVREAAEAFGVVQVEAAGYEADDVIATLARQAVEDGLDVDIFSGDKDLMQLITPLGAEPSVHMIDPMHFDRVDHDDVIKKWGVPSDMLGDVLALAGDAADNIPGAPGIGPKIAATLLHEYGTLSNLFAQADNVKQKKRRESLIENAEKVLLFRELVTLDDSIPANKMTSSTLFQGMSSLRMSSFDSNRLFDFYKRMELNACQNQLQSRLRSSGVNYKPPPSSEEYKNVPF